MASFVGEASSSSPISSSTPCSWTYHVFLSFSGKDARKGFVDHLFASLERNGITTFKDDRALQKGDTISDELLKAIEESMFAIVVLSPNYGSSTWCLKELQKIVECSKSRGLFVVPVFYGVEPSDVRCQKGSFEEAFKKHQERFVQDIERVQKWRDALTQVTSISGWDSKDEYEASLIERIVEHIQKKLIPKLPSCTEDLVGIASRVEEVIRFIGIGLNDIRFVGIWGMGGIGKTTTARAVYEAIQDEFEVCCFMRNVRELSETNGFVHLQRNFLSRLNINSSNLYDEEDGRKKIKTSLHNKKVLLVLDDISQEIQLKNLAWKQDWFGPGSRIIITTKDMHLLNRHGVHGTYEVRGLQRDEANCLFCLRAFNQHEPKEGYSDLSREVVKYTQGLPLAVEVLGSYLCGRNIDFWHETIKELKSGPHFEILKALKISYDHLMPTEKNIFLDIACFFKGIDKNKVTRILKMCDNYVGVGSGIGSGIVTLIDKSLVTLDQNNKLEMHDLLQEMGRHVVYEESPNNPGKRSRLWSTNDIDRVLTNDMGTEAIHGIVLLPSFSYSALHEARWNTKAFSKTSQLKYLLLHSVGLPLGLNCLPSSLKVLHWQQCDLKTLPLADQQNEIVEMKLHYSKLEQLWYGTKNLEKLKYLDLSYSEELHETPDLSAVPILETLVLKSCSGLTKVHPSLACHKNLILLNLSGCKRLETLPGKLEMNSLKELILDDCHCIKSLPEFGECMIQLSRLSFKDTAIRKLPLSLGCLKSPPSVSRLPFLSTLDLSFCFLTDEAFPPNFGHLPSLVDLDLSSNSFVSMPINVHELPKLRRLKLNNCIELRSFPYLPSSVREVEACLCYSLGRTFQFNLLSKVRSFFASPSQEEDQGQVLQIVISGSEIPSWFVHGQEGDCISIGNCPDLNERLGIALCFRLPNFQCVSCESIYGIYSLHLAVRCGDRIITDRVSPDMFAGDPYLYILCMSAGYFRQKQLHQENCFELLIRKRIGSNVSLPSFAAARWVCSKDIEGNQFYPFDLSCQFTIIRDLNGV